MLDATNLKGVLLFTLYTRKVDYANPENWLMNGKHPDMDAKKFVGVALNYFEVNGYKIKNIRDQWSGSPEVGKGQSINFYFYEKALKEGKNHEEALCKTWSAQTYAMYGFIKPRNFRKRLDESGKPVIQVDFYR